MTCRHCAPDTTAYWVKAVIEGNLIGRPGVCPVLAAAAKCSRGPAGRHLMCHRNDSFWGMAVAQPVTGRIAVEVFAWCSHPQRDHPCVVSALRQCGEHFAQRRDGRAVFEELPCRVDDAAIVEGTRQYCVSCHSLMQGLT